MNAGILEVWRVFDFIYQHITRIEYVDKENGNIFRVVFCKYRGPQLITKDGVTINNGDPIVKLHIHNWKLANILKGIKNETRLGITTLKIVRESLPYLATYIEEHPKGKNAKALVGTTFLHRGVNKLGFDTAHVPNTLKFKWKNLYLKVLLILVHPDGAKRLKIRPEEIRIKRVYMSKNQLLNRYNYSQILEEKV